MKHKLTSSWWRLLEVVKLWKGKQSVAKSADNHPWPLNKVDVNLRSDCQSFTVLVKNRKTNFVLKRCFDGGSSLTERPLVTFNLFFAFRVRGTNTAHTRRQGEVVLWPEQRLPHTEQPTCSLELFFLGRYQISYETRSIHQIGSAFASVLITSLIQITNHIYETMQLNPRKQKEGRNRPRERTRLKKEWCYHMTECCERANIVQRETRWC